MQKSEKDMFPTEFTDMLGMKFIHILPGSFLMGYTPYNPERGSHEFRHQVTLTKEYYLQATPVTQDQWQAIMESNPSSFEDNGGDSPVETVSWEDVQEFIEKLNQRDGAFKYRLPSEAEWEYAAKAGRDTRFCYGDNYSKLKKYAWYKDNSGLKTHPVSLKNPNSWDLYDMHGNVWEWCQDWHDRYPSGSATDPLGPDSGSNRIIRGGSWGSDIWFCNSTDRFGRPPDFMAYNLGFRLAGESFPTG